ncbi:DUF2563 family protein [Mycolicibacterium rhodesiae]|uniref:DUF2563 domain-containing protein n=1 Tax=Mycolicibacterium rhodesiae TaxID=36814 RepID=A0A1X0IZU1_MYCRH|nr:DUF2563 family protein [Mycolicibacterium rhodesiae]MCV7345201.1 DUF2563 family protein [Mycolicibacterium rhodesiae]ORB54836.1 hypothetical protein BST42_08545 [Mycolicibacterium rhodesiae]
MQVDLGEMRSGANRSYNAADRAQEGASALSRTAVAPGIFGAFETAEAFHSSLSQKHTHHVTRMADHSVGLGALGDKAHRAASGFSDMEELNTEAVREVLWPSTQA